MWLLVVYLVSPVCDSMDVSDWKKSGKLLTVATQDYWIKGRWEVCFSVKINGKNRHCEHILEFKLLTFTIKLLVILPPKAEFIWEQKRIVIQNKQVRAKPQATSPRGKQEVGEVLINKKSIWFHSGHDLRMVWLSPASGTTLSAEFACLSPSASFFSLSH